MESAVCRMIEQPTRIDVKPDCRSVDAAADILRRHEDVDWVAAYFESLEDGKRRANGDAFCCEFG
jgi:hypothetical protein